jgi:hypothetical protein
MTEVYASSVIAAPADQVWARVRDFDGLPSWRPLIAIETFLAHKWSKELDYRLIGELWAFTDNRIAVRFTSEYHDIRDAWYRAYGGEHWEFDLDGLIRRRYCSVNECSIAETGRMFLWPPGPGPHDHPQLSHFAL